MEDSRKIYVRTIDLIITIHWELFQQSDILQPRQSQEGIREVFITPHRSTGKIIHLPVRPVPLLNQEQDGNNVRPRYFNLNYISK